MTVTVLPVVQGQTWNVGQLQERFDLHCQLLLGLQAQPAGQPSSVINTQLQLHHISFTSTLHLISHILILSKPIVWSPQHIRIRISCIYLALLAKIKLQYCQCNMQTIIVQYCLSSYNVSLILSPNILYFVLQSADLLQSAD